MPKSSRVIKVTKDTQLEELLATIDYMETFNDTVINSSTPSSSRQALALATYSAATQYAAGIKIMLEKKPMSKVCEPLIRSMFEAWINLEYMLLGKDDKNLLLNIWESLDQQKKRMTYVKEFFEDNNIENISGQTLKKVNAMISNKTKELRIIEKALKPKVSGKISTLKLYQKAELVDKINGYDEPGHSIYYNYQMVYGHWSASVHLGYDGLSSWVEIDGSEFIVNGNESLDDVKRILWTAIAILKDISILAITELDLYDEDYDKKIQEIIERNN